MTEPTTIEVWIAIDSSGDYGVGQDAEQATDDYKNNWEVQGSLRVVQLNVTMALPEDVEVNVSVPDEAGQTVTAEVAP